MVNRINTLFFSGTGTTEKIVAVLAKKLTVQMEGEVEVNSINFTLPEVREKALSFTDKDLVIVGIPVYAGRVPNVLLNYLNSITGNGALAVAVVLYGNRNYDDALIELTDILNNDGFKVVGGGAFIGEHSFSNTLAQNRPDASDIKKVADFAGQIYKKISNPLIDSPVTIKGQKPYRKYYQPKDRYGNPFEFRKIKPNTNKDNCIDCKICFDVCPMGSIDYEDTSILNGICIKCCACIKKCPVEAKYFDDENYLKHQHELEDIYAQRREPELFI